MTPPSPPITVLVALEMEAAAIRRHAPRSPEFEVIRVGPRAAALAESELEPLRTRAVIVAGIAGALNPALRTGDVVVTQGSAHEPIPGFHTGTLHTARDVVDGSEAKARLRAQTGADAVDMEHAVLEQRLGRPLPGVRAIADTARDALPAFMTDLVTADGRPRIARTARLVAADLRRLAALARAARQARRACRALGPAVLAIIGSTQGVDASEKIRPQPASVLQRDREPGRETRG